jgi:exodeoxyribonuclease VII small subunit
MSNESKPTSSFRDALKELEAITSQLESEDIDLDEALGAFERGNELVKSLQEQLTRAEQSVQKVQLPDTDTSDSTE